MIVNIERLKCDLRRAITTEQSKIAGIINTSLRNRYDLKLSLNIIDDRRNCNYHLIHKRKEYSGHAICKHLFEDGTLKAIELTFKGKGIDVIKDMTGDSQLVFPVTSEISTAYRNALRYSVLYKDLYLTQTLNDEQLSHAGNI